MDEGSDAAIPLLRVFVLLLLITAILQIATLCRLLRQSGLKETGATAVHSSLAALRWLRATLPRPRAVDQATRFELKVQESVNEARLHRFQTFARASSIMLVPGVCSRIRELLEHYRVFCGNIDEVEATSIYFEDHNHHVWYAVMVSSILVCAVPRGVPSRLVDAAEVLLFVIFGTELWLQPAPKRWMSASLWEYRLARFVIAVAYGNPLLVTLLNATLTVLTVTVISVNWADAFDRLPFLQDRIIKEEIIVGFIVTSLVSATLATWDEKLARSNLSARLATQGEAAVSMLLSGLCDATVQVDNAGLITKPSPQLSGLLIRKQVDLEGASFEGLVAEEDRPRFKAYFGNGDVEAQGSGAHATIGAAPEEDVPPTERTVAPALHVRLVDVKGNQVHVQLLHARCCDADDNRVHLFGVRDLTGVREPVHATEGETHIDIAVDNPIPTEDLRRHTRSSMSLTSRPSTGGYTTDEDSAGGRPRFCQVCITAAAPHLVRSFSTTFEKKYGPVISGDLFDGWLVDPSATLPWLADYAEDVRAGRVAAGSFYLPTVKVRTRSRREAKRSLLAFFHEAGFITIQLGPAGDFLPTPRTLEDCQEAAEALCFLQKPLGKLRTQTVGDLSTVTGLTATMSHTGAGDHSDPVCTLAVNGIASL